tara:strand:- start:122 stop:235 length:114 start_codon:yes stop_codon:yes gene_type:complete
MLLSDEDIKKRLREIDEEVDKIAEESENIAKMFFSLF